MKNLAAILVAFCLVSCGSNSDSNRDDGNARATFQPFAGEWTITSKKCGGQERVSPGESIVIDSGPNLISHVYITSESQNQICKKVDAYSFVMTFSTMTDVNSQKSAVAGGDLSETVNRTACWAKVNGQRQEPAIFDQTVNSSGPSFTGLVQQSSANQMRLESESSPFCEGKKTKIELRR